MEVSEDRTRIEVVALVASAGGLDALSVVLRSLPPDLPAAVVVQQHLGGQASILPTIFQRRLGRHVVWACDGAAVVPGPVMICPPGMRMEILPDGTCSLIRVESASDRPHDHLLASLADSYGPRALAVVLTGGGSDGAVGTTALTAAAGVVLAQSEDTAEHPSMPVAAAKAGADLVLPLHEIGAVVTDVVHGGPVPLAGAEVEAIRATFGDEGAVAALAQKIDWSRHPLGPVHGWPTQLRELLRLVVDCPDPAQLVWANGMFTFFNESSLPTFGEWWTSAFARPLSEAPSGTAEQVLPRQARLMGGEPIRLREQLVPYQQDGRVEDHWFDVVHIPVRGPDGSVTGVHIVHSDRTAEVLASRRLAAVNRLATAPAAPSRRRTLADVLAVLRTAEDVPFALAYLLDTTGSRVHLVAAVGIGEGSTLAPRDMRSARGNAWPVHEVVEARRPRVVTDVATRFPGSVADGERLTSEGAMLYPLRDEAGDKVVGVLVLGTHPRLRLDDRYREFLTLVGETVTAKVAEAHARERERQRLEQLAELDRAKTEFFSNVSHEFRTPLTLMLAPLQEVLRSACDLPDGVAAELAIAERNGRRLLRLVGSLLDFSQVEAGRLRARLRPTDLAALTREVASVFSRAAEVAGLTMTVDAPALPEPVWVDPEMWEMIVSHLMSNALKFTWAGGVEVAVRALPMHVELVVRDTGVGIPADQLPDVLQRFHRVPETRGRTHEGAGIGLALVDELVRRHRGRVRVTSTEGEGTTVTVWLPQGPRRAAEAEPAPAASIGQIAAAMADEAAHWDDARELAPAVLGFDEDAGGMPSCRARGARVLVVDDNADMRDYLVRVFRSTWHVAAACDGDEALELARRNRPDLVLADVMMPRLDGFALLGKIRADVTLADIPVVLLAARAEEETGIEGLLAGADDYVVKPFSARELVARVDAQLQLARMRRRHSELNAFRVALTDALRTISDPAEVQGRAAELLGRQLGASRAYYQEFDHAAGTFTIHRNYTVGLPSLAGTYRLADFGGDLVDETLQAGLPLVVRDSAELDEAEAGSWAALSVRAGVAAPNLRRGICVAALGITSAAPRDWTEEEIALVEETAERTWAYVECVRAEGELRTSEERFRTVADTVPALIWQTDAGGKNVFVNRYSLDFTGLPAGEISGERWHALVHPDDVDAYVSGYLDAVKKQVSWHDRNRIRRSDGTWRNFDNYASPLFDADGNYLGHVGVSVDVTAR